MTPMMDNKTAYTKEVYHVSSGVLFLSLFLTVISFTHRPRSHGVKGVNGPPTFLGEGSIVCT